LRGERFIHPLSTPVPEKKKNRAHGHGTAEAITSARANQSVHAIVNWRADAPIANA